MQTPYLVPNPDGADYSSPRCRPLSETANRLDGASFFSCLLMLFSYFWLVRVFGIGVGGAEKRELNEMERNARLSPATWNERGEAVSGLGRERTHQDPSTSFPLFSSPDHPLFFDTIFTSALSTVRIFRVAGAADAVTPRMTHCCQMEVWRRSLPYNPGAPTSTLSSSVSVCVADKAPVKPKSLFSRCYLVPIRRLSPTLATPHASQHRWTLTTVVLSDSASPSSWSPPSSCPGTPPRGAQGKPLCDQPPPDWLSGPRYLFCDGSLWSGSKPQHPRGDTEPPALHSLVFPTILHSTLPPSLCSGPSSPRKASELITTSCPPPPFLLSLPLCCQASPR